MTAKVRIAAVQMNSSEDKAANRATATRLVEEAAGAGAQFVVLPELFACLGSPARMVASAEPVPGPTSEELASLAARLGVTLLAGSLAERSGEATKVFNTSLLFGPDGTLLAAYRKRHLFDIDLPGRVTFSESSWCLAGREVVVTDTAVGRVGQAICYDLRFPEQFRALAELGVELIAVPSAFTATTGRDHWEVLLRARAIENQAYVVAPNQWGRHGAGIETYGRSIIIDPWGTPLAMAADGEGWIVAEMDAARLATVRAQLPALTHRRALE